MKPVCAPKQRIFILLQCNYALSYRHKYRSLFTNSWCSLSFHRLLTFHQQTHHNGDLKWKGSPMNYRMTAFTYENIQAIWNVCVAVWLHALGMIMNMQVSWCHRWEVCKMPASLIGFNEVHFLWELIVIGSHGTTQPVPEIVLEQCG